MGLVSRGASRRFPQNTVSWEKKQRIYIYIYIYFFFPSHIELKKPSIAQEETPGGGSLVSVLARQATKGKRRVGSHLGSERGWGWFCKEQMGNVVLEHLRDADLGWRESSLGAQWG